MTRNVALRSSLLFVVLTLVFGTLAAASDAGLPEALFLITATVGGLMAAFAAAAPVARAVPVRIRR